MVSEMLFKRGFPGYDQKILAKKTRSCHTVSQRDKKRGKMGRWEAGKLGSQEDRKEHREKKLIKTILIKSFWRSRKGLAATAY
jgi:hypothetical protein